MSPCHQVYKYTKITSLAGDGERGDVRGGNIFNSNRAQGLLTPETRKSKTQTRNSNLEDRDPKTQTRNDPETRNPKTQTRNSDPEIRKPELRVAFQRAFRYAKP